MIRKGQMQGVERGDMLSQATFIAELFGAASEAQQDGRGSPEHPLRFFATQPLLESLTSEYLSFFLFIASNILEKLVSFTVQPQGCTPLLEPVFLSSCFHVHCVSGLPDASRRAQAVL
jgi:hypothetical protein